MKRNFLRTAVCLLTVVGILFLPSCAPKPETLDVISEDYPRLKEMIAQEPNAEIIENWSDGDNPYLDYTCFLSMENDEIHVSNQQPQWNQEESKVLFLNGSYYLIGLNLGEFEGWIALFRDTYYAQAEGTDMSKLENQLIADENYCGFIELSYTEILCLTGLAHMSTDYGHIYRMTYDEETRTWSWALFADLGSMPLAYYYAQETQTVYVATRTQLLSVDRSGNVTVLFESELWQYMWATSMIRKDRYLYIGMCMGIYRFDLETGTATWFSFDLEKFE